MPSPVASSVTNVRSADTSARGPRPSMAYPASRARPHGVHHLDHVEDRLVAGPVTMPRALSPALPRVGSIGGQQHEGEVERRRRRCRHDGLAEGLPQGVGALQPGPVRGERPGHVEGPVLPVRSTATMFTSTPRPEYFTSSAVTLKPQSFRSATAISLALRPSCTARDWKSPASSVGSAARARDFPPGCRPGRAGSSLGSAGEPASRRRDALVRAGHVVGVGVVADVVAAGAHRRHRRWSPTP